MRRQPKAIHRIRKVLHRKSLEASLVVSPLDESTNSFSVSEQKEALAATLEYNSRSRLSHQHYEEELSIDEFIGRDEDRRYQSIPPVVNYFPQTDSFGSGNGSGTKRKVERCTSVDSANLSSRYSGSSRGAFDAHLKPGNASAKSSNTANTAVSAVSARLDPDSANGHVIHADVANRKDLEVKSADVIEFPIACNPLIDEDTDFEGDEQLPFLTPSASVEDVVDHGTSSTENPREGTAENGTAASPRMALLLVNGGGKENGASHEDVVDHKGHGTSSTENPQEGDSSTAENGMAASPRMALLLVNGRGKENGVSREEKDENGIGFCPTLDSS